MIFDNLDLEKLPSSAEEAFVSFEKQLRASYEEYSQHEREYQGNQDQNGNYCGSYPPERSYVSSVLAFIDEYNLDVDVPDISKLRGNEFIEQFEDFKSKIGYIVLRFTLRKNRIQDGAIGTVVSIASSYKSEIGSLLETIRKIVNQEELDINKKDKIYSKISSLQSEIDREQTTVDALFTRMIDLSSTVGECAEKLEPAISKLERIKKLLWDNTKKVELLPKKNRQNLITKQPENQQFGSSPSELEDEIPF